MDYGSFLTRDYKTTRRAGAQKQRFRPNKLHMLVVLASLVSLGTLLTFISHDAKATRAHKLENTSSAITQKLVVPLSIPEKTGEDAPPEAVNRTWQTHTVKKGESLARIFKQQKLSPQILHRIMTSGTAAAILRRLQPGQQLEFHLGEDNELQELVYHLNRTRSLLVKKIDTDYSAHINEQATELRTTFASATIKNSLFMAGHNAGLSDTLIMQLAAIYAWDIDFALDIRAGDQFNVLYQEQFLNGEKLGDGDIVAAEFINQGHSYKAIRFTDSEGRSDYYTPEGLSMRKAFLRTPVDFRRISSRFGERHHPILNTMRMHKGVDYAAARGTPIKAAGDGKIIFRGRKGGYGRTIIIQHGGRYSTLYAHMSRYRKHIRGGSRVRQGQVIGYVGSSGRATGPHLHYEFRVNGVHRNPLTVKLPNAAPIKAKFKAAFIQRAHSLQAQLQMHTETRVALHQAQ